jgi:hypothetical protein
MAQHTPANNVIYPANVSHLRRVWAYTTGDAIASSPVVAGSNDHSLYAFNQIYISSGEKRQ